MKKFRLYFDTDKEAIWLNQMAEAGYALNGYFFGVYTFEKCEPGKYVYQIDYTEGMFRVENAYRDFMNEMGVEIIALWGPWVYLRKYASEGPFELYSDVESRVAHYEKIRGIYKAVAIVELLGVFLEMLAGINGFALGWMFACILAALAIAFIRQCFNISAILADLKSRLGEAEENMYLNMRKKRPSLLLSVGFLLNAIGFLPMTAEFDALKGFLQGMAIVFLLAGTVFTVRNLAEKN